MAACTVTHKRRRLSSSSTSRWDYDVFLSFRGEDTRRNFTDHLYEALHRVAIRTFRDDGRLKRGEEIEPALLKAIEQSRIAIIVFSRNYASSTWCLKEVAKIMECRERMDQMVFPVFYDVNPSDVRNQTGDFGEEFDKVKQRADMEMKKVEGWEAALTKAANLSGWDLPNVANGHEATCIQKIVGVVSTILSSSKLYVSKYPVGLTSRVDDVISMLNLQSDEVVIVGICGMGGIGKTTIAKAVYNQILFKFEGRSFLGCGREALGNQLVRLQRRLLSDILMEKKERKDIHHVARGIIEIRSRVCNKKVLVVLDDIHYIEQINFLVGERNWFGAGSRIIITTRDEDLLRGLIDRVYKVKELGMKQSAELFSWHAFKLNHPMEKYVDLTNRMIDRVGGLPLAIEVLGSDLSNRSIPEWEDTLNKLQKIPNGKIQNILRISYDNGLDDTQKEIFLDISCFLNGMDKDYATIILDACGFYPKIGISVLTSKSLVRIDGYNNKLRMHNLLQDMGREVVRGESPQEPGRRSRLWSWDDAYDVMTKHEGTKRIEGLILEPPEGHKCFGETLLLSTEAFKRMSNLRLLKLHNVTLVGRSYRYISEKLRWLCWPFCPLKSIPVDFRLSHLVVLEMKSSRLQQVWVEGMQPLSMLKIIDLSYSVYLTKNPDFSKLPNLETLILKGCSKLVEVCESIGCLKRLVHLDLSWCSKLGYLPNSIGELNSLQVLDLHSTAIKQLPSSIGHWKCLEDLYLGYCKQLEELPEELGFMESLKVLDLSGTAIKQLPSSIGQLKCLEFLNLNYCGKLEELPEELGKIGSLTTLDLGETAIKQLPSSIGHWKSLEILYLGYCKQLEELPEELGKLESLRELDLSKTAIKQLPFSIGQLKSLKVLFLDCNLKPQLL